MTTTHAPRVAVVDTGVAVDHRSDGWLSDVDRFSVDAEGAVHHDRVDRLFYLPDADRLEFGAGHGTFVAGIVAQVCPTARITAYRALASDAVGSELEIGQALLRAAQDGADVINLSMGHQSQDDIPSVALSAAMALVQRLEEDEAREIVVVASAGNFGDARPTWPAALPSVVAVGAVGPDLRPLPWASHGPWVDVAAVGQGVLSTYVPGDVYDDDGTLLETFGTDAFARWSGTSFAAPQVSGAVAREMAATGLPARQALARVVASAVTVAEGEPPVLHVLDGL